MISSFETLWPEIALFLTTCVVMVVGLSPNRKTRGYTGAIAGIGLAVAALLALFVAPLPESPVPGLAVYGKVLVAGIGILLLMLMSGAPDREYEEEVARGARFDPLRAVRGEFYAFFLFSLTGLMLCTSAADLIMLFLALELTSLPTYVMVAISSRKARSLEAAVKYFFLGAFGAAVFLYGFALIYGATGATNFLQIQAVLAEQAASGGINAIAIAGLVLAAVGVCFKIAAVPMHFYTPDVYQGATSPVAAFLAFVPKSAGFFALILLMTLPGWIYGDGAATGAGHLPGPVHAALWVIAALTMTVGNVLALLQTSVKRVLAYSSIAHSGYMLVGIIAGPGPAAADGTTEFARNGLSAVLFYLFAYGVMNLGAFAVLASLERRRSDGSIEEAESYADIRGLCQTRPLLGWMMVICSMGLLGLPLTLGFMSKLPLFTSGIAAGQIVLVVILGLNSAVAAYYYLGLARAALLESPEVAVAPPAETPFRPRIAAGVVSMIAVVLLGVAPSMFGEAAHRAGGMGRFGEAPADPLTPRGAAIDSAEREPAALLDSGR